MNWIYCKKLYEIYRFLKMLFLINGSEHLKNLLKIEKNYIFIFDKTV